MKNNHKDVWDAIKELTVQQAKTDEQMKKTDKYVGRLTDSQGAFWEGITEKGVEHFLIKRGYKIIESRHNVEIRNAKGEIVKELDLVFLAKKGRSREIFVAEAKSTANVKEVDRFLDWLKQLPHISEIYKGKVVWGAIASGRFSNGTAIYAIKRGLLVFAVKGELIEILNSPKTIKPIIANGKR